MGALKGNADHPISIAQVSDRSLSVPYQQKRCLALRHQTGSGAAKLPRDWPLADGVDWWCYRMVMLIRV